MLPEPKKTVRHPPMSNSPIFSRMSAVAIILKASCYLVLCSACSSTLRAQDQPSSTTTENCSSVANLKTPKFRVAKKSYADMPPQDILVVDVSTERKHFDRQDLLKLTCKFSRTFKDRPVVMVNVFHAWETARNYDIAHGNTPPRARYIRDRKTGEWYIKWQPFAESDHLSDAGNWWPMRINLKDEGSVMDQRDGTARVAVAR